MKRHGFTLIETIFALLVISFAILLFSLYLKFMRQVNIPMYIGEDEVAIRQLRLHYALSSDVYIDDTRLQLQYYGEWIDFHVLQDRLVQSPGYQVYFQDIEWLVFIEEEGCIYVEFKHRKNTQQKAILGC